MDYIVVKSHTLAPNIQSIPLVTSLFQNEVFNIYIVLQVAIVLASLFLLQVTYAFPVSINVIVRNN